MANDEWLDYAACRDHPLLEPDSWFQINFGYPHGVGAQAALVCRFACPVAIECRNHIQGRDIIAGGGWYNRNGVFHQERDGEIELHQAAAYIGMGVARLQDLVSRKRVTPVRRFRNRTFLSLADVRRLSCVYGPVHGTLRALQLHQLRGERPCESCAAADDAVHALVN